LKVGVEEGSRSQLDNSRLNGNPDFSYEFCFGYIIIDKYRIKYMFVVLKVQ
jgi:hypothetical protein